MGAKRKPAEGQISFEEGAKLKRLAEEKLAKEKKEAEEARSFIHKIVTGEIKQGSLEATAKKPEPRRGAPPRRAFPQKASSLEAASAAKPADGDELDESKPLPPPESYFDESGQHFTGIAPTDELPGGYTKKHK
jgi:hypothetical protein